MATTPEKIARDVSDAPRPRTQPRTHRLRRLATGVIAGLVLIGLKPLAGTASADHSFTTSTGVYRIPYADGTQVTVTRDHHDHAPVDDRIDMVGDDGETIAAAASGTIRAVVDFNGDDPEEHSCTDDDTVAGDCSDYNNYVWIEHPNGEWTKYSHFETGTVTANGWAVGDPITVGQVLGIESDVGAASGSHLHFEVAVPSDPSDPTPFSTLGGFIQGVNVVPVVCDIPGNLYETGETYTANPCTNQAPVADAGGPYSVDEGSNVVFDGTGSTDPDGDPLTYLWSPAGQLDDATSPTPTYTGADDTVDQLTLTVTDPGDTTSLSALSDSDDTTVTVRNVPPTVFATGDAIDEGGTAEVSAVFNDPGLFDTHTASVDWGDGAQTQAVSVAQLAAGVSHAYGDNGSFDVTVTVTDDDGGVGADTVPVVVANLDPTATLDTSGAVSFPGGDYLIASTGNTLAASADGSDPGSDDLSFTWSVGQSTTYFNDGLGPDPLPSPLGTYPFAASDGIDAVYATPGVEVLGVTVGDDDGGSAGDQAEVLVTGNADATKGAGWWKHQYSGKGSPQLDPATAAGYLEVVNAVSSVFSEAISAATAADVHTVLSPTGDDRRARAAAQLMSAWLELASGAVEWDATVSLGGGASVGYLELLFAAEDTILDPNATDAELQAVEKDLAHVHPGG